MEDKTIHCEFQGNIKQIYLNQNFEQFKYECVRAFKKNNINEYQFFFYDQDNEKIIIKNQKDFFENIINSDENDDLPIINMAKKHAQNNKDYSEIEELKKDYDKMLSEINQLKNEISFYTEKNNTLEKNYFILNKEFKQFKEEHEKIINEIRNEISNISHHSSINISNPRNFRKQSTPNPYNTNGEKPHLRTPGENKNRQSLNNKNNNFDYNKENIYKKNINENVDFSNEDSQRNKNKNYSNNQSRKEKNKKGNYDQNYNNKSENNTNSKNDNTENYYNNENNNSQNYNNENYYNKENNNSQNYNNENYYNKENNNTQNVNSESNYNNETFNLKNNNNENYNIINDNDNNIQENNNNEFENSYEKNFEDENNRRSMKNKTNNSEKETHDYNINEIGSLKYENKNKNNNLSCEIIINQRTLIKLKLNYYKQKKKPLKFDIQIKNTGINPIPANSKLIGKNNDNESDLYMDDIIINNGQEIKPNEVIDVTMFAFFKDPNNIKSEDNFLKFYLYNENYGQIGNEGIIKIFVLDEKKNIIENSRIIKKDEISIFNDGIITDKKNSDLQNIMTNKKLNKNENFDNEDTSN